MFVLRYVHRKISGQTEKQSEKEVKTEEETSSLLEPDLPEHVSNYSSTEMIENTDSESLLVSPSETITWLSDVWGAYLSLLEQHPVLVKSITAFFILGLADLSAQGIEHVNRTSTAGVDWIRCIRFGSFGLFGAPFSHFYFHLLDYYFKPTPEPFTKTTLLKLFIDQFIQAPILLAFMISALSLMKGEGLAGIKTDIGNNYWTSLVANWGLWVPASLINMAFVRPELRVLYVNVVFFFWTIILSIILNRRE